MWWSLLVVPARRFRFGKTRAGGAAVGADPSVSGRGLPPWAEARTVVRGKRARGGKPLLGEGEALGRSMVFGGLV